MTTITIAVCLHQRDHSDLYAQALGALYVSAYTRTTRPLRFFIVHDKSLDASTKSRLMTLFGSRPEDEARFISVDKCRDASRIGELYQRSRFSPAALWRCFYPELIPANRFISMDADSLFLCPPDYVFDFDLNGHPIGARARGGIPLPLEYLELLGTPAQQYFRMGLCLFDNDRLRKSRDFMLNRIDFIMKELPKINRLRNLPEQSVFNFYFHDKWCSLPVCLLPVKGAFSEIDTGGRWDHEIAEAVGVVLDIKGWKDETPYSLHYWSSLLETPWRHVALAHWGKLLESTA